MNDIKFLFPETPQQLIYEFNRRLKSDEYPDKSVVWTWYESEANILKGKGYMDYDFLYPCSILKLNELYNVLFNKEPSEHIKSKDELKTEIFTKAFKENRCLTKEEIKKLENYMN